MQPDKPIQFLLTKYRQGTASAEEIRQLEQWLDETAAAGEAYRFTNDADKEATRQQIAAGIITAGKKSYPWLRYVSVAAVLLLVSVLIYLFASPDEISLVSAPGQVRQYRLPDGTRLWLNEHTELRYHKNFAQNRAIRLLRGEAFFDVQKDAEHPFTIRTQELVTTVLGTSFSVKLVQATGDVKVSVVTGKVQVNDAHNTLGVLQARQRLRIEHKTGQALVDTVLNGEADGWLSDNILMENASLAEVVQWLEDHFSVKVENRRPDYHGAYYLQVKKEISLPEVLQILNLTSGSHVQFSQKNQTVLVQ